MEHFRVRSAGGGALGGVRCSRIEAVPRSAERSGYERTVSCIDPERAVALYTDFYRDGERVKRLEVDPTEIHEIAGRRIPHRAVLRALDGEIETEIRIDDYAAHDDLPDRLFSALALERSLPFPDPSAPEE